MAFVLPRNQPRPARLCCIGALQRSATHGVKITSGDFLSMSANYDEDDSNHHTPAQREVKKPVRRWSDNPIRDAALRLLNTVPPRREDPDDIEVDPPPD